MTLGSLKSSIQDVINSTATSLGINNTTEIGETANGEAITDAIASILNTVRTISPDKNTYPKIKT